MTNNEAKLDLEAIEAGLEANYPPKHREEVRNLIRQIRLLQKLEHLSDVVIKEHEKTVAALAIANADLLAACEVARSYIGDAVVIHEATLGGVSRANNVLAVLDHAIAKAKGELPK